MAEHRFSTAREKLWIGEANELKALRDNYERALNSVTQAQLHKKSELGTRDQEFANSCRSDVRAFLAQDWQSVCNTGRRIEANTPRGK